MSLLPSRKQELINGFQLHGTDTGSPEVQIALLTARIASLTEHLKVHRKDFTSERGLKILISQRKRLLAYIQRENPERHQALVQRLGIRA